MNYKVKTGLYKIGTPDRQSPVLVTSNYKLTFDSVRKELSELNIWLLVLDTNGVNVWCAAGKGTFGTEELIKKIQSSNLSKLVAHKTIILPQLGAPGIAAHIIKNETGFGVVYGPVYAKDIPAFLANELCAATHMRRVHFGIRERLKVIPVEIVYSWWLIPLVLVLAVIFRVLDGTGLTHQILLDCIPFAGAYIIGTVVFQIFLPWLPGRSFAFKGYLLGFLWTATINYLGSYSLLQNISHFFIVPVIASFWALNFTGATTFTSRSGVIKEMRIAIPLMIVSVVSGLILGIIPLLTQ